MASTSYSKAAPWPGAHAGRPCITTELVLARELGLYTCRQSARQQPTHGTLMRPLPAAPTWLCTIWRRTATWSSQAPTLATTLASEHGCRGCAWPVWAQCKGQARPWQVAQVRLGGTLHHSADRRGTPQTYGAYTDRMNACRAALSQTPGHLLEQDTLQNTNRGSCSTDAALVQCCGRLCLHSVTGHSSAQVSSRLSSEGFKWLSGCICVHKLPAVQMLERLETLAASRECRL